MMRSPLLVAPARRGRSLRSELMLWQLGTLLLVIGVLGVATLLFTGHYVRSQFVQIRQTQAQGVLFNTDLPLVLQDVQADEQVQDDWMSHWRTDAGAALLAGWNTQGRMTFDALSPELAQAFIGENGQALVKDGEGIRTVAGQPYYWRSEKLFDGQHAAGQAVVAFSVPSQTALLRETAKEGLPLLALVTALALLSAFWLGRRLRRTLLDLEPADIAALTVQQGQLLSTVQDGVIILDAQGQVTVANGVAAQALGLTRLPVSLALVWPELAQLPADQILRRQALALAGRAVLVNAAPLSAGQRLVTLTDRQEATRLAEELTDTRRFVDAVRARAHEYGNRLHIIAGFLQLGQSGEALRVIQDELDTEAQLGQALSQVAEPRVAALLVGKVARAHELRLTLTLAPDIEVPSLTPDQSDALVTALGNYIENAFEVLGDTVGGVVRVEIGVDPDGLSAEVRDNGAGVSAALDPFAAGQTTKGLGRGQGLAGVAQLARAVGGEVGWGRQGEWTVFRCNFPLAPAREDR